MIFLWEYTHLVALPHHYEEAIETWNVTHSDNQFKPQQGSEFTFQWFYSPPASANNLTMDEVIKALIVNGVPVSWINHAYLYSLNFISQHFGCSLLSSDVYEKLDNQCLAHLTHFDELDAILLWSGWWYPNQDDLHRIHILSCVNAQQGKSPSIRGYWTLYGASSTFTHLHSHPSSIPAPTLTLSIAGPSCLSQRGSNDSVAVTAMDMSDDPQPTDEMELPPDSPLLLAIIF
ncbi:hypothetical protein BDQ17DRAFT_1432837 [Cyathus striatus]|nr:hypothetical protein BDQ17DRAFT_1432837 [Cyathus striatus]